MKTTVTAIPVLGLLCCAAFPLLAGEPLPPPWKHQDIGAVQTPGTAEHAAGAFTLQGTLDIWGTADGCHLAWQPLHGDAELAARVTAMDNPGKVDHAKASLCIRESLDSGARSVTMCVTPADGTQFLYRDTAKGKTVRIFPDAAALKTSVPKGQFPCWLKIVRRGNEFSGYESLDGEKWQLSAQIKLDLAADTVAGLAASSHRTDILTKAVFDHVKLAKQPANAPPKTSHEPDVRPLKIGDAAPDFSLPGIDGKTHALAEYKDAKLLMVAFLSNHCPDSQASEGRIKKFVDDMKGQSFALIAVNPNHPDAVSPEELGYAKYSDGFDDMKKHAAEQKFNFPYLYDGETQAVAKAYGCLATPHVFLFDAQRKLRYQGAFDDSRFADPATVTSTDARNAVAALLAGKPVPVEVTKPHGCSTKWLYKKQLVAVQNEKWGHTPVDVALIDAAGATALRKNGTRKLRLINVWATSCVPCIREFPELVQTSRRFATRDFELITISADDPKDTAKVKAFLEKQGAALPGRVRQSLKGEGRKTNSYIFRGADMNALMNILDPQWPGGMPHTVLISPDGRVLWRQNGPLDGDKLRGAVLDYLGRFYKP